MHIPDGTEKEIVEDLDSAVTGTWGSRRYGNNGRSASATG